MTDETPLFISSDNALGARFGDVDDGFALSAILMRKYPLVALASTFGNTFEPSVFRNHLSLAKECGVSPEIVRGAGTWWTRRSEASDSLAEIDEPVRVLSIGPMTDIALALRARPALESQIRELVFVGTNRSLPLPAWRIFDFNQWKDPAAVHAVFDSRIPLTCIPCDVARQLRVTWDEVSALKGRVGKYLARHAERWFKRSRALKGIESVPLWDLTVAMYVLEPGLFEVTETTAELTRFGQAVYGGIGARPIRLVTNFEPAKVWNGFRKIVSTERVGRAA